MYQFENKFNPISACPELEKCCDNPSVGYKSGVKVCSNCGTVLGQIFVESERRAYTPDEINQRRQTEPLWREFGPRTILPCNRIDSKGQVITAKKGLLFSRLAKIQRSLITSLERNYWEAKPKLKMYTSKLNIPAYISETAWRIYCETVKKKLTMGRSIDGFIAASLYAAIRIHEFPKLLDDVSEASMVPNHTLFRALGMIVKEILPILGLNYHPISADKLIILFGNKLELPEDIKIKALNLFNETFKNNLLLIGKDPRGLAAAMIYVVAKDTKFKKTQVEVAQAAKVTEVTIRSRLKDLKDLTEKQTSKVLKLN